MPHRLVRKSLDYLEGPHEPMWFKMILDRLDEPPIVNRVPFQLWVMLASFNAGVGIFMAQEAPKSIAVNLSPFFLYVWVFMLIAFPVAILYSLLKKNRVDGLRLECYLLFPFGLTILVYPVAVVEYAGAQAIITALFSVCCALSCITTSIFIRRKLVRLRLWNQSDIS